MRGYGIEDGQVQSYYEFRHLAFQEYLAALAIAREWTPSDSQGSAVELLRPHFTEADWSEVIVLCSVLLGRRGGLLVDALMSAVDEIFSEEPPDDENDDYYGNTILLTNIMYSCITDEAQMKPEQARAALAQVIELGNIHSCEALLDSRYETLAVELIWQALADPAINIELGSEYFWLAADVIMRQVIREPERDLVAILSELFESTEICDHLAALSVILRSTYEKLGGGDSPGYPETFAVFADSVPSFEERTFRLLESYNGNLFVWACGCWTLGWAHSIFDMNRDAQLRIGPRVREVLFQTTSRAAASFAGLLIAEAFSETSTELANGLTSEQAEAVTRQLSDSGSGDYGERIALGIAMIAAGDVGRFGLKRILRFCEVRMSGYKSQWQLIINLATSVAPK